MKKVLTVLAAAALSAGLTASFAGPATAEDEPAADAAHHPSGPTMFGLVRYDQHGQQLAAGWLTCQPTHGSPANPAHVCNELRRHAGNFDLLPTTPGFCTMEYNPVTVKAVGLWDGEWVDYTHEYGNDCAARHGAAGAFDF